MKIFGYGRVSKQEQAMESDSLEQQIARLRNAGAEQVLVDVESGRSDSREKFNELLRLVELGQVREIIVTRVDRLGRSVITLGRAFELFERCKVKLRILDAPLDINSPYGWWGASQMASLAEFESRLMAQRIQHGMTYFRQQGKVYQKALFGYRKNSLGKLEPNLDVHASGKTYWEIARMVVDKLINGETMQRLSKELHEDYNIKLSPTGMRNWIENPSLTGHTSYFRRQDKPYFKGKDFKQTETVYNTHEALLNDEELSAIKKNRTNNRKNFTSNKPGKYPLVGQIKCAVCKGSMFRIVAPHKTKTEYIRCGKRNRGSHLCSNSKNNKLELVISQVINHLIQKAEEVVQKIQLAQNPDNKPNPELLELQKQLSALENLRSNNPAILQAITDLKAQIINFEAMLSRQATLDNSGENYELWYSYCQADFWESLSRDKLHDIFAELIDAVFVDEGGNVLSVTFSL